MQLVLMLKGKNSRASLAELEVYLMDDPDTSKQTTYLTASGAAVLTNQDSASDHVVNEVNKNVPYSSE